jgi:hypothetical protein
VEHLRVSDNSDNKPPEAIPASRTIAFGEEAQREAMHREIEAGIFDSERHFEHHPIIRAIKAGFPTPNLNHWSDRLGSKDSGS